MDELVKEYMLGLLKWQKTKLECINLGWTQNKEIKTELQLIEMAEKKLKKNYKKED